MNSKTSRVSDEIVAAIVTADDADIKNTLASVLSKAKLGELLKKTCNQRKQPAASLKIVIIPDLEHFDVNSSTGVAPQLVEQVISWLYQHGYNDVTVGSSVGSNDLWLENRDPTILADLAGYRYATDAGRAYDVINLSKDTIAAGFSQDSILFDSQLNSQWLKADFRICIGKNKTHEEYFFGLCGYTLLNVLPLRDKEYHYCHRLDTGETVVEILKQTPVDFCIIDALISNHGNMGVLQNNPLPTNTIIASADLALTDWIGGLKMGWDPYVSPINRAILYAYGLPKKYRIDGSSAPYIGWVKVSPIHAESVKLRNRSLMLSRLIRPWFQQVNPELFPFKHALDQKLNKTFSSLTGKDKGVFSEAGIIGFNYVLGIFHQLFQSYQIMHLKERMYRRERQLGFDARQYSEDDYKSIIDYIEPLAELVKNTPPDRNGLRWRYIDKSVLFECRRILPVAYDVFVEKVDIGAAVRMMNDNIGGAREIIARDKKRRVIRQAERTIYLPQPNWMSYYGGDILDVGKIQFIRYAKDRQEIFWRSVASANDSTIYDDGVVRFVNQGGENTEIVIVARQHFKLPLIWQVLNLDYIPSVKDVLVSDAYTTYFSRTMANYEAAYEGRNVQIGREFNKRLGEDQMNDEAEMLLKFKEGIGQLSAFIEPFLSKTAGNSFSGFWDVLKLKFRPGETSRENDNQVFENLNQTVITFIKELYAAVQKDTAMNRQFK